MLSWGVFKKCGEWIWDRGLLTWALHEGGVCLRVFNVPYAWEIRGANLPRPLGCQPAPRPYFCLYLVDCLLNIKLRLITGITYWTKLIPSEYRHQFKLSLRCLQLTTKLIIRKNHTDITQKYFFRIISEPRSTWPCYFYGNFVML